MHNLPDIVKAITLNNKLDESRDFATLVQRAMVDHLGERQQGHTGPRREAGALCRAHWRRHAEHPRGNLVRHAPAGGTAPEDRRYRQKIAEALFDGLREYQRSLKNVKAASGATGSKGASGAPGRR